MPESFDAGVLLASLLVSGRNVLDGGLINSPIEWDDFLDLALF